MEENQCATLFLFIATNVRTLKPYVSLVKFLILFLDKGHPLDGVIGMQRFENYFLLFRRVYLGLHWRLRCLLVRFLN